MSHVVKIELQITDLEALRVACEALGLELRHGQRTYRWYGRTEGAGHDLPAGFTEADLGHCDHAIAVKGQSSAYEVGIAKRRDGRPGYVMLADFVDYRLTDKIGQGATRLKQQYGAAVSSRTLQRQGFRVQQRITADGKIVLSATR